MLSRSIRQRAVARMLNSHTPSLQPRRAMSKPTLQNEDTWAQDGVGRFMSPEQFKIAWTDNHERLMRELSRLTDGTNFAGQTPLNILKQTARDPDLAQLFNYASMAHNHHHFFSTLAAAPTRGSAALGKELEEHFSSIGSLRETVLSAAEAMFAPGFVWLVQNRSANASHVRSKFAVLNTYAAGSPYAAASFRRQEQHTATQDNGVKRGAAIGMNAIFHQRSAQAATVPGGVDANPVLCVSTWEHAYLHDYGVAGRRRYLEAWWDHIDWAKVEEHLNRKVEEEEEKEKQRWE